MSETRTPYRLTPEEIMQREEDSRENEEWEFLQTCLNALNTQKAGIEQQADAIRKRLGIPKKR